MLSMEPLEDFQYAVDQKDSLIFWDEQFEFDWLSGFFHCTRSVVGQTADGLFLTLVLCCTCRVFRFVLQHLPIWRGPFSQLPVFLNYIVSITSGLVLLWYFYGEPVMLLTFVGCLALNFLVVPAIFSNGGLLYLVLMSSALVQLYGELWMEPTRWHQVRGSIMIIIMKAISLAWDMSSLPPASKNQPGVSNPVVWKYSSPRLFFGWLAYALCPASLVFGPWSSFTLFEQITCPNISKDQSKREGFFQQFLLQFLCIAMTLAGGLSCLIWSTCVSQLILPDAHSHRWIHAYFASQSFRFSHYFVSYTSQALMATFGFGRSAAHGKLTENEPIPVTCMSRVEFPRSLVDVVVSWNLPMHTWLKQYVYKRVRPFGHAQAILATYTASALLHGMNFQLSAVLLSIGIFAYIEYVLREQLALTFDACISSRPCRPNCSHRNKNQLSVRCCNFGFTCLAVFHLAYLAVMFDTSEQQLQGYSMRHALNKWSDLGFMSHYVALATYIFYMLIS